MTATTHRHPATHWLARVCAVLASLFAPRPAAAPAVDGLLPVLAERIARIEALGRVAVTVDPAFMPVECGWCRPDRPAITSVRVHGAAADDELLNPLRVVEVCFGCAVNPRTGPIRQAQIEAAAPAAVIRVEVCE